MFPRILTVRKVHMALVLAALGAMLLWIFAWIFAGLLADEDASALQNALVPMGPFSPGTLTGSLLQDFFQACLLAPICEEIFFRWSFCAIAYDAKGQPRGNWSLPLVVMTCGLLFGASHGFRYGFSYEMFIRMGMLGLILAALWVMLKRRGASALVALGCCIFVHGAYNFSVGTAQNVAFRAERQGYDLGLQEGTETCKEMFKKLLKQGIIKLEQKPAP